MSRLALALGALVALGISFAGCSVATPAPTMETSSAVGKSLETVNDIVTDQTTLLVQDVSPRVGEVAAFEDPDAGDEWSVVAACADSTKIENAKTVEVAVIPKSAYTEAVKAEVKAGEFDDAVACNGLKYR